MEEKYDDLTDKFELGDNLSTYHKGDDPLMRIGFRTRLYKMLTKNLSDVLKEGDLDIFIRLICYLFGDLEYNAEKLKTFISIDKIESSLVENLGSNIGFPYNRALTADKQREYIKQFLLIRQRRGTKWSIENLCRVFGQDVDSYYSAADLRGVELWEYPKHKDRPAGPKYPGDLVLRVPELTTILYDAICDTKLAGTRLFFLFYFFIGVFHYCPELDTNTILEVYFDPKDGNDDILIKNWGPEWLDSPISELWDWQISHNVISAEVTGSCFVKVKKVKPYEKGWILHLPGVKDYHGLMLDQYTMIDNEQLYSGPQNNDVI